MEDVPNFVCCIMLHVCGCTVGWCVLGSQLGVVQQQAVRDRGLDRKVRRRKPHAKAVKNSAPLPLPAGESRALHAPPSLPHMP